MLAVDKQDDHGRSLNAGDLLRMLAMHTPQRVKVNETDIEPEIAVLMFYKRGHVAIRYDLHHLRIEFLHDRGQSRGAVLRDQQPMTLAHAPTTPIGMAKCCVACQPK